MFALSTTFLKNLLSLSYIIVTHNPYFPALPVRPDLCI